MRLALVIYLLVLTPVAVFASESDEKNTRMICNEGVDICVAKKRKEYENRGTLGMLVHPISGELVQSSSAKWRVARIVPSGAAAEAGVEEGDLIVEWNRQVIPLDEVSYLDNALEAIKIDEVIEIKVLRENKPLSLQLKAQQPESITMEYWLLFYVHENYSEAEFEEYQRRIEEQMRGKAGQAPPSQ